MEIYLTEQEQLEALKRWWKNYGLASILGIIIALVGSFVWHQWRAYQERMYMQASMRYEQLLTHVANNDNKAIIASAEYLIKRYPKTYYAKLASLLLARESISKKEYTAAETQLSWVTTSAHDPALRQIARLRLARVLLGESKSKEALQILSTIDDRNYLPLINDVKGDIFVVQGNLAQAKVAYGEALQSAPELATVYPLLQMKYNSVSGAALAGTDS